MRETRSRRSLMFGERAAVPAPVRPPWSSEASVAAHCTACGDCSLVCPTKIISHDARGRPVVDFARGACTFCGACAEACETPVFAFAAGAPGFAHRVAIGRGCLAERDIVCAACGDACPETAIRFPPRLGGSPRPALDTGRCTGCGACLGVCPVDAIAVTPAERVVAHG